VVEGCSASIPQQDKQNINNWSNTLDLQWLADRSSAQWTAGFHDDGTTRSGSTPQVNLNKYDLQNSQIQFLSQLSVPDPWSACFMAYFEHDRLPAACKQAVLHAWPIVHFRLTQLFETVNPVPPADNRVGSTLLRGPPPKKPNNEKDISMHLWRNYIALACRVVPQQVNIQI
jgi:hypothetical protein